MSFQRKTISYVTFLSCLVAISSVDAQQRAVPGVNPNQYNDHQPQHSPPPQHQGQQFAQPAQQFQQQPQQYQQTQQFQQQVPVQHVQQQQQQQVPVQHVQQPRRFEGNPQVLHKDVSHEKEHMKEHMDVPIDTSNMSEAELQFHYFKMHDSDGNNKLDGSELVKSLIHWHDASNHEADSGQPVPEEKIFKDDELVKMIDPILASDDKNQDGYIDYSEFVLAQQAAQAKEKP